MVFEQIERLKREYTDKYVVVDDTRPELRRFRGQTGTVRTVNMSGRALVEFDAHENIGWYDIELDFLKVVDQPLPKAEKPAAKPAKAAAKPAAKPAAAKKPGAGLSMEEMLAAARGEKAGGAAAQTAPSEAKPASEKAAPATPVKAAPQKMSVEEILAAARAEKSAAAGAANAAEPSEPPAEQPAAAESPATEAAPTAEATTTKATSRGDLPTDTADIVEYCRRTDAG